MPPSTMCFYLCGATFSMADSDHIAGFDGSPASVGNPGTGSTGVAESKTAGVTDTGPADTLDGIGADQAGIPDCTGVGQACILGGIDADQAGILGGTGADLVDIVDGIAVDQACIPDAAAAGIAKGRCILVEHATVHHTAHAKEEEHSLPVKREQTGFHHRGAH